MFKVLRKFLRHYYKLTFYISVATTAAILAALVIMVSGYWQMAAGYDFRKSPQTSRIYAQDGTLLYEIYGNENRILVEEDDISKVMKQATIASEDRRFYQHPGVDFEAVVRAMWINLRNGEVTQGGSTISQQLVKNVFYKHHRQRKYSQKMKEMLLSLLMEARFSKDEIITFYFNEAPYGGNIYGVGAASLTYFNKEAKDLTYAEAATLAALPKAPTYYSPYGEHQDELLGRRNYVLKEMKDMGVMSEEKWHAAIQEPMVFQHKKDEFLAPHFVMEIRKQLFAKYGKEKVETGGLVVKSTLDTNYQKTVEEVTKNSIPSLGKRGASNMAAVVIDPKTGAVLAMAGSRDYFDKTIDGNVNVATSPRQPGSAFKPIVYATLFKGKWSPGSTLYDLKTNFATDKFPYEPDNYDKKFRGPLSIREALANSLNVPAVKTLDLAGVDESIDTAHRLGITTLNDSSRYGLALVLGGGEIKLVELAGAYGAFANNGNYQPLTYWQEIVDGEGKILGKHELDNQAVIEPAIAYEISNILSDPGARAPIFGRNSTLNIPNHTVAAKTGTTEGYRDAWTIGYTPSLVVGVWVGNNDNRPMLTGSAGAMAAAPIWHELMARFLAGKPNEDFVRPDNIQEIELDSLTGKKPVRQVSSLRKDIIAPWQVPDDVSLARAVGCGQESVVGVLVHSERPDNPNWEKPVATWARERGYATGDRSIACNVPKEKPPEPDLVKKEEASQQNVGGDGGVDLQKIDQVPPAIDLDCQDKDNQVMCVVSAQDDSGIKTLSLNINGDLYSLAPEGGSVTWMPPGPGVYFATVQAIDMYGNQASLVNTIRVRGGA